MLGAFETILGLKIMKMCLDMHVCLFKGIIIGIIFVSLHVIVE